MALVDGMLRELEEEAVTTRRVLRAPRKPGIVYMLARENWAWNPTQEDLGGLSSSHMPVVLWPGQPDAFIIVMAQDSSRH